MRTKTIKSKLIIAFSLIAMACVALSVFFAGSAAKARGAELVENPFLTEYGYGDTIEMPSELEVSYEGKTYRSTGGYIKFPDNKIYVAGKYALDSYGVYTITYEFEANGKTVATEHSFIVNAEAYTVGQGSVCRADTLNADFGNVSGLRLLLAPNETFTYNKPINVYNGGTTELISFNFMSCEATVRDAIIRLTDCYDPSVYVDIQYSKTGTEDTYLLVGACGKASYGVWNNAKGAQVIKTVNINGEECKINDKGNYIPSNRKQERHPTAITRDRYNNITLSVDASDKNKLRFYAATSPEKAVNSIISELNNPDIYGYEFGGFTTGEVFISITAKSVTGAEYAETEIAALAGVKGDALAPSVIKDEKGPELIFNTQSKSLNVMAGVEVKLPEVTAYDASGLRGEPEILAYYGYGTSFESSVEVKNGRFVPQYLGTYTILYSAADVFGNVSTSQISLNAVKTGSEGIDFSYEKITDAVAGQVVSLGDYVAKSLNSEVNVSVTVTDPTGKKTSLDGKNKNYLLERAGKYKVEYAFYDDLYSGESSYEFDCVDKGMYRIDAEKVFMPEYVIAGATYSTEDIKAYKYGTAAPEKCDIKGYASYDGGEYKEINPDNFVIENASTLKIRVVCADDKNSFIESDEIKIVDVNYGTSELKLENYFAGDFAGSRSKNAPDYTAYALTKGKSGTINFVNPLLLSDFSLKFSLSDAKSGAFGLILTDYYDRTNSIEIKFGDKVSVNGREIVLTDSYVGTPITVSCDSSGKFSVGSWSDSIAYDFTSQRVLLSIKFENATEAGSFNVYSVCGQPFGYYTAADTVKPSVYAEVPEKVANIGDVITIDKPDFCDVLSPSSRMNCTVSVYKDGEPLKSSDGVLIKEAYAFGDYSFKIDGCGTYLILYKYTDGAGKLGDLRSTVSVIDEEAPVIRLSGYNGSPVQAEVNKTIKPLSYTVSDNFSDESAIDVLIVVYNKKGVRVATTRDTFSIATAGKYTVYVCCFDEAGNSAYVTYSLIVK